MRAHLLLAALFVALAAAPVASAASGEDAGAGPTGCFSTLDMPPSHIWCEAGGMRVDCYNQGGLTYRCE